MADEAVRPVRVQLSRKKGWRMPPNTVSVARPTFWGNSYPVVLDRVWAGGDEDEEGIPTDVGPWLCQLEPGKQAGWWFATRAEAIVKSVAMYRFRLTHVMFSAPYRARLGELRGKNLACWCPLDQPCHADVLLEMANG